MDTDLFNSTIGDDMNKQSKTKTQPSQPVSAPATPEAAPATIEAVTQYVDSLLAGKVKPPHKYSAKVLDDMKQAKQAIDSTGARLQQLIDEHAALKDKRSALIGVYQHAASSLYAWRDDKEG